MTIKKRIDCVVVHPQFEEDGLGIFWNNLPEEYHKNFEVISCDGSDLEIELNSEIIRKLEPSFVFFVEEMNPRYGTPVLFKYLEILTEQKRNNEFPVLCHFDTQKKNGFGTEAIEKLLNIYKNNPLDCIQEMIGFRIS